MLYALALLLLAPFIAFAQDAPVADPAVEFLGSLGLNGTTLLIAIVVLAALRGAAATIAKHVPDSKLGRIAGLINGLGGNGKHAQNARGWAIAIGLGIALLGSPSASYAQDGGAPLIGCNGAGCSLYVLEYEWPLSFGVNGVEFVYVGLDVGQAETVGTQRINYLGGACLLGFVREKIGFLCAARP